LNPISEQLVSSALVSKANAGGTIAKINNPVNISLSIEIAIKKTFNYPSNMLNITAKD
jgi:hypothetical protein